MGLRTTIVVPCFNEAERLDVGTFREFAQGHPDVRLLFVNDGSSDATLEMLGEFASEDPTRRLVHDQQPNQGKAQAVRSGMQIAFRLGGEYAGFWDADLATPLDEVPRFVATLDEHPTRDIAFGARVQLLGHDIERSATRHYLGRVFATAASTILGIPVYDTQCGAKLFRVTDDVRTLFAEPFEVNWTFDVEIVARLIRLSRQTGRPGPAESICEIPLNRWRDVAGSKVGPVDFIRAIGELRRVKRRYLRRNAPELPTVAPSDNDPRS